MWRNFNGIFFKDLYLQEQMGNQAETSNIQNLGSYSNEVIKSYDFPLRVRLY